MATDATKACTKCGEVKLLVWFHKRKDSFLGVKSECKVCACARDKKYREAHPEKVRAAARASSERYRKANKTKVSEYMNRYSSANKEKVSERKKIHRNVNRERDSRAQAARRASNKEKVSEYMRRYRSANKEKLLDASRSARSALTDTYISNFLVFATGVPRAHITDQLINLKRDQLTMRRLARQLRKASNESSKDTDRITGEHAASSCVGRLAPDRGEQPVGAGPQGDQRHGCGGDGEGTGLDQQQPER